MSGGFWDESAPSSGPQRSGGAGPSRRHTPYPAQPKAPDPTAAPAQLPDITVRCKAKSWQADVSWEWPTASSSVEWSWWVRVAETAAPEHTSQAELPSGRRQMNLRVKAGKWYSVAVEARSEAGSTLAKGEGKFKSIFDRDELLSLYDKCVRYAGSRLERFRVFYRHKPKKYWDNIAASRNHVMEKYIKDLNGQEASPINEVIYGLFWSANLRSGKIPNTSPFGDIRMLVHPPNLFSPKHKLYFADFYCNSKKSSTARNNTKDDDDKISGVHYMTVVVCVAGSETDDYCSKALIPLDPLNNPFLKIDVLGPDNYQYWVNTGLWVEVYYTENVHTNLASDWQSAIGRGTSRPGGLANNKDCDVCNLYPAGVYPDEEAEAAAEEEAGPAGHPVESVIAGLGPRIPLPKPGHAGRPAVTEKAKTVEDLPEAEKAKAAEDLPEARPNVVEVTLDVEEEAASEGATEEGRSVLHRLDAAHRRLDKDFEALGRMLTAVQDSIAALQKKTRLPPKYPKTQ